MHYVLIIVAVIVILVLQIQNYLSIKQRLKSYSEIFPTSIEKEYVIGQKGIIKDKESQELQTLKTKLRDVEKEIEFIEWDEKVTFPLSNMEKEYKYKEKKELKEKIENIKKVNKKVKRNEVWETIVKGINKYLDKNNGNVNDFHLIKDIVDRNCDAEEEAIQSQIPIPLYYGLIGTMAGIVIGVGYLWISGGLDFLLSTDSPEEFKEATNSISGLLGGVAIAMICSAVGIGMTIWGTTKMKTEKIIVEKRKHNVLSWIQAELLPKLNNDFGSVLDKVSANLNEFNKTFATNAKELHNVLNDVNQATAGQTQLLQTINELKIKKVVTANIEVYDKLKNCTDEIGMIAKHISACREYLDSVKALNEKLDASEQRTRAIEDMAIFFKEERANLEQMNSRINQSVGAIENSLHNTIENLKEVSTKEISELTAYTTEQGQRLQKAIDEQYNVLQQKTKEISQLVSNFSSVSKMIENLNNSAKQQSQSINSLVEEIRILATQKAAGNITIKREKLSIWVKIPLIAGGVIVCTYCIWQLVLNIISLFGNN